MKKLLVVILVILMMAICVTGEEPVPTTGSQGDTKSGGEQGSSTIGKGNGGSGPQKGP